MATDKLDTVRKLLAKAEGAATTAEADAYNAKAMELIARHGIDEALLALDEHRDETPTSKRIYIDNPYSGRKSDLLCWIGHALGCRNVVYGGRTVTSVILYGFASDLERVELLYTSLLLQATAQLVHLKSPDPLWEGTAAYRNSWFSGFASRVSQRIREAETTAQEAVQVEREQAPATASGPSVALVLVDRKKRVELLVEENHPKLKTRRHSKLSGSGQGDGALAGNRADIGNRRVGGHRQELGA